MKTRPPSVAPLALAALVWLAPERALAEPPQGREGTTPQLVYRAAHEAMDKKNWEEARRLLLTLWNKAHTYDVAASLSEVEYVRGDYLASARYLAFALANVVPTASPAAVQRLEEAFEQVQAQVGIVRVSVNQKDAEIRVDGESIGRSPLEGDVYVNPGPHVFEARLGNETTQRTIEASAGGTYTIDFELSPTAARPRAGDSLPNETRPRAPLPPDTQPQGSELPGKSAVPIYIGVGVTAVGFATWVGFGISASSAKDDANDLKGILQKESGTSSCVQPDAVQRACNELKEANERQRSRGKVSNVGFGVTLVGAVATLGYVLFWPDDAPKSRLAGVRPSATFNRSGGGVLFTGNF